MRDRVPVGADEFHPRELVDAELRVPEAGRGWECRLKVEGLTEQGIFLGENMGGVLGVEDGGGAH